MHAAHFSVYLEQVADAAYVDRRERVDQYHRVRCHELAGADAHTEGTT